MHACRTQTSPYSQSSPLETEILGGINLAYIISQDHSDTYIS